MKPNTAKIIGFHIDMNAAQFTGREKILAWTFDSLRETLEEHPPCRKKKN